MLGYATISVENILDSPAENGAQISDVFLPFITPCKHKTLETTVPLVKSEDSEQINNVAERQKKKR